MVLIAAAVCTKAGKTIISRQFVEMTKARIEGLLAAFPKLMCTGKQHTFVETESVRYVYQPLDKLYMLLITTKASNILEDLETLRLFSRVIPEYCRNMDEADIAENGFNLIFAFDEIVALGYRENVNLAQIRTYVEMDSHEEKVFIAVRQTQEREAKNIMREKAKELQRQKMEQVKRGIKQTNGPAGSYSSSNSYISTPAVVVDSTLENKPPANTISKPRGGGVSVNAMKLKAKSRDVESFVDQLKSEGEHVISASNINNTKAASQTAAIVPQTEDVHLKQEEKLHVVVGRDGGVQSLELFGLVTLRLSDENKAKLRVHIENQDTRPIQLQTHPNVDKELFKAKGLIGLKNSSKPFPTGTDVGVLKWRYQSQDENALPLSINCWPSENGQGGCDVNIEYQLEHSHLQLYDVIINVPIPMNSHVIVNECDGDYKIESRKGLLVWSHAVIESASNSTGSIEFTIQTSCSPSQLFPLHVSFTSNNSYTDIKATQVTMVEDDSPVKFSSETVFFTEKYEII